MKLLKNIKGAQSCEQKALKKDAIRSKKPRFCSLEHSINIS